MLQRMWVMGGGTSAVLLPTSVWLALQEELLWAASATMGWLVALLLLVPRLQFLAGGALVNLGFRMQDHLRDDGLSPGQLLGQVLEQNRLAAGVRRLFPRSSPKPTVALVVCMDARLDTSELVGDTRKRYYVLRTAGSVLGEDEQDMLELAVANGVRLILLTTHTDCAAERVAGEEEHACALPSLACGVRQREASLRRFLSRPAIAERLARGALLVAQARIDTATAQLHRLPESALS